MPCEYDHTYRQRLTINILHRLVYVGLTESPVTTAIAIAAKREQHENVECSDVWRVSDKSDETASNALDKTFVAALPYHVYPRRAFGPFSTGMRPPHG
jgi:hypothetical protein